MSKTVQVLVKSDHLARLAAAKSPIAAIAELIWNSLDADATHVAVSVNRNLMGGVDSVVVTDDGRGMSYPQTLDAFASLGGSSKRERRRTPGGRFQHGRLGKGRFKAFAIGVNVEWTTVFADSKGNLSYKITGQKESLSSFTFSDPQSANDRPTGTTVAISGIEGALRALEAASAIEALAGEFALYLRQYPAAGIVYEGRSIDPASVVLNETALDLPSIATDDGQVYPARLSIIEWGVAVDRALFLCDAGGVTLARLPAAIHAPGFNFTAYASSEYVRRAEQEGTLELEGLSPELDLLVGASKKALKAHFRARESQRAANLVEAWKKEDVYPYSEVPHNLVQQVEQQVFDVLALNVHTYLPDFEEATPSSRKLTFRLIRQALESDASSLQTILKDVLGLPDEKRAELAALLERTTLSAIISASKIVGDRLNFLRGLDVLVFQEPTRDTLRERDQLHRIVADNTWLFGEQFNLAVDDQSLTEVLKAHCAQLGIDVLDATPVLRDDGTRGIVDLMLSRSIPQPRSEIHEHLVIELKRPSVAIGATELTQVESYALAVARDERFRHTDTSWDFWAISNDVSELIAAKSAQPNRPEGLVTELDSGRIRIWVRTWAQLIRGATARMQFFQEKLAYRADTDSALDFLRQTYARYLPPQLPDDTSTAA